MIVVEVRRVLLRVQPRQMSEKPIDASREENTLLIHTEGFTTSPLALIAIRRIVDES